MNHQIQTQPQPPPPPPSSPPPPRQAQRSERWGPEIYVHLEFRVSWGRKQQSPKSHQVTYRSRGTRERSTVFPRQVPAPNTNYLAAIHTFDQRQTRLREMRQRYANTRNHQMQEYYQGYPAQQGAHLQLPVVREPDRPTRADARPSSHERGRSAPPPIGENPWDVSVPPFQTRHSDMATLNRPAMEIKRKPLPAPPSQFRLGEGRHPWSTWSLPDGFDPDALPQDDDDNNENNNNNNNNDDDDDDDEYEDMLVHSAASPGGGNRNSATYATNPTMVSTFSPEPPATTTTSSSSPLRARDLETGRAKELGALSAAMMTVDNGFESQWWYQGQRETHHEHHPAPFTPDESPVIHHHSHHHHYRRLSDRDHHPMSALSETYASSFIMPPETPVPMAAGVVSPMTEAALSPAAPRSMSTRSEELWFREGGR
ncbi:hypothetical protein N657DRAFT_663280 [Parathielavia appendiculata]|uniref:Uncharacterized protein n=1 Tax=Parathielavia appendiculata TaxID=2587402 RepID=A0AAN6U0F6_9PEZI|nr:hypothetical protein N657DRAFT_663280 [Parathielavia appendiculata]